MPASGHAPKSFAQPKAMEPIELLCLEDNTTQVHSSVGIDTPLFQPYPTEVRFRDYAPFSCIERTLRFRNNDHVARRIKVLQPKSPYFEVSGPHARGKDVTLKQSKVATGMEVCFVVKFRPQEVREYKVDLVCCTEREKFIVPVRAFGLRAALSLPEEVDFGTAAVKSTKQRSLLVQNIGACTAVFKLSCDTPEIFQASPSESITQVGQMATLELSFTPQKVEPYSGTLLVEFLGDETRVVTVALKGIAEDVDVHLSANSVALEPAYVSLSSQTTFRIRNASEIPVLFSWKQFSNMAEQEAERSRLHSDLERMQQLEEAHLEETLRQDELAALAHHGHGFSNQPQSDESDGDLSGDEGNVPGATRAARSALTTKYRHLRQALEKDDMVFADENFEIKPLSGEVRALSEIEVSVTFRPDTAADYACTAYLDVMGREERLPIWLTGLGIGPKGALSYDVLDMGDVFISSPYEYSLGITNKGDIPAEWKLFPPPTTTFQFSPTSGVLAVGGSEELTVHFMGTTLGEFCELVDVALDGSNEKLTCQFKGHVIGPTFNFDIDIIEFGLCSYSFAHVRTLDLTNTADIPMDFNLSIPQDGQFGRHEFVVEPRTGTLPPGETVRVSVTLTPMSVKVYDFYLVVDVPGVGDALLSLPISAECLVPDVTVAEQELDFERCFLRYPYERELVLVNGHDQLSARYAVAAQEPQTTVVGEYACEPGAGVIPPGGIVRVTVTVRCHKLGNFRLPLTTSIAGSAQPPLAATMTAVVCGPDLSIEPKELSWGATECLVDAPRTVTLRNNCCIPAPFKTFVKNARSKFRVDVRESVLAPMDAVDLQVVACLDDTTMHRDQLHVVVAEGENLMMPLSARGIGTTMFCHEDLKVLDFGAQFTANFFERKITLENKGRRPQVLKWVNETWQQHLVTQSKKNRGAKAADDKEKKGPGGGKDSSAVVAKPKANVGAPTFTVVPEEVELRPRTAAIFTFRGYSTHKGLLEEKMVCETRVHKEKQSKPVFYTTVKADVIEPLLSFSSPSLGFVHDHEPDVPIQPQSQALTLKNNAVLPLVFALRCAVPFSVDAWEHTLEPDEETTVRVDFDPGYKGDRQSQKLDTRLTVAYHQHPQRDSVGLVGEINFPNLHFEYSVVNFGCILNDTTMTMRVRVTNCSKVETAFSWAFLEDEEASKATSTTKKPYIPINQVFDILPIRSRLKPGEVEDVDFIYYGHAGRKFKGTCLCEVEGGPEYNIVLLGEASTVGYKLDRASLDFGNVLYTKSEDLEFNIVNTGKVAFPFTISLGKSLDLAGLLAKRDDDEPPAVGSASDVLEVHPTTGRVAANDKQTIVVRLKPGLPETFRENLVIEVAHFEPVDFPITGTGIYASVSVSLPRDAKKMAHNLGADLGTTWASAISKTREFLQQERLNAAELLPPPPPAATTQPFAAPLPMASSAAGAAAAIAANDAQTDPASTTPPSDSAPPSGAATPKPSTAQTTGAMREPSFTMAEIEAETNRRIFLDHLKKEEEKRRSHSRPHTHEGDHAERPHPPPTASSHGGDGHDHGFVLAWHACDFGNVVSGTHRKRTFRITNSSLTGPLSWFFEKKVLANTGFSIEPEKVVRLAEGATATFEVNFNAKKSLRLGHKELLLPVDVKNGPLTCIVLQANVTMPDISLSAEALDFGPVWVGCGRTMHVQIHNTSPVLAEWDFKKAMGAARDEARFTLSPRSGALLPGRKQNVAVEFVPVDDRPCSLKLPLKVNQSTKTWLVNFAGAGVTAKLQFSPSVVEIGPVLPFEDGTGRPGTTATTVTMKNASDRPVEVFSLDFDDEYVTEEAFLSTYDAFGEDGLLRLPVRNLGEKLPINMDPPVEEDAGPEGEEEEGEEPPAEEAGEEAAAEEAAVAPDDGLEDDADALGGAADGETLRSSGRAKDVCLVAPPLAGGPELATKLAEAHGYAVCTPLGCVHALSAVRSDLGKKARKALGCEVPGDAPPEPAEGEEPPAEPAEGEEGYVPPEPEPSLDDPNFLAACLAWRAGRADSGRGLVVDASEPAPGAPVLEVVAGAVPLALPGSTMATLTLSDAQYLARLKALDDEAARTSHALEGLVDPPLAETQNIGEAAAAPEDGEEAAKLPSRALLKAQMVDKARPSARAPEPPHDAADDPKRVVGGVAVLRTAAATVQSRVLEVADDALSSLRPAVEPPADESAAAPVQPPHVAFAEASAKATAAFEAVVAAEAQAKADAEAAEKLAAAEAAAEAGEEPPAEEEAAEDVLEEEQPPPRCVTFGVVEEPVVEVPAEEPAAEGADEPDAAADDAASAAASAEPSAPEPAAPEAAVEPVDLDAATPLERFLAAVPGPAEPLPDPSVVPIPPAVTQQLVRRPPPRAPRSTQQHFTIVAAPPTTPEPVEGEEDEEADAAEPEPAAEGGDEPPAKPKRWVIPAQSEVQFAVNFLSTQVGRSHASLGFEVVGLPSHEFTLPCVGSCAVPTINGDPRNVFMTRVKNRPPPRAQPLSKRFVLNANEFEFGPLLTWKQPPMRLPAPEREEGAPEPTPEEAEAAQAAAELRTLVRGTNCDTFRMSNNGPFATAVDFHFRTSEPPADGGAEDPEQPCVFYADPPRMELEPGETRDLEVWAFPRAQGACDDTLLACVAMNPEPYAFAVRCAGVEPELTLSGPWSDGDGVTAPDDEPAADEPPPTPVLDFDRLLLGRSEMREFTLTNANLCPVAWRLDLAALEPFARELRVEPASGRLGIHGSARITVSFSAVEPLTLDPTLFVEYSDDEGGLQSEERVRKLELVVKAEAYLIRAIVLDEDPDKPPEDPKAAAKGKGKGAPAAEEVDPADEKTQPGTLDFGQMRVGETAQLGFALRNRGKYDFSFKFGFRRAAYTEIFSVSPSEGLIEADGSVRVVVSFCSRGEVKLSDNKDISCTISEPITGEAVESFPVTVAATSLFPRFRVQPGRGLTFGTVKFNDPPKERKFDLRNEGKFSFAFAIADADGDMDATARKRLLGATPLALIATADEDEAVEMGLLPAREEPDIEEVEDEAPEDAEKRRAERALAIAEERRAFYAQAPSVGDAEAPPDGAVSLGQFVVAPGGGVVEPGQSLQVTVTFNPEGCAVHKGNLRIAVAGCDGRDAAVAAASAYELFAESRSPGINCADFYQIFEEQAVIASLGDADGGDPGAAAKAGSIFATKEKVFSFGTTALTDDDKGFGERFKITNPNKVAAVVNFAISPKAAEGGREDPRSVGGADVFTVQPANCEVPPHEHRYVTVYFHANEMREYRAMFAATVEDSAEAETGALSFELAGRGTLPSVAIEGVDHGDGGQSLDFGRLQVGRSRSRTLTVRNDGVLNATALVNFNVADRHFGCAHAGGSVQLSPGESRDVTVTFKALPWAPLPEGEPATEARDVSAKLALKVLDNKYEATTVVLKGATFETDVSIEKLPDDVEDELKFGELNLASGETALTAEFTVRNLRPRTVRFEWPDHATVAFSPKVGHLLPGGSRTVTATFTPGAEPLSLDEELSLDTQQIALTPPAEDDESPLILDTLLEGAWDSDARVEREATAAERAIIDGVASEDDRPKERRASNAKDKGKKGEPAGDAGELPPGVAAGPVTDDGAQLVVVTPPEPAFEGAADKQAQPLKCVAVADAPGFECDAKGLTFKTIPMYQSLCSTFELRNTSTIALPYRWVLTNAGGDPSQTAGGRRPTTGLAVMQPIPSPFSVSPSSGDVAPNSSQTFSVHFAPMEVDDYYYALEADMPSLARPPPAADAAAEPPAEDGAEAPTPLEPVRVGLRGRATRPACHIDLNEDGDYLARRQPNLLNEHGHRDQIEATNVRIVEVSSRGLRVQNTKRFHVVNPTASSYDFVWEPSGQPHAAWRCGTPRGMILSGKRGEMVFEFTPNTVGVAEAFYRFKIPEHGIDELFLFVGQVVEPRVTFDRTRVDFNAVMLGNMASETVHLVNSEHLPFAFNFEKPGIDNDGPGAAPRRHPTLEISPLSGLVPPNGRAAIELSFRPGEESLVNTNLMCTVRKKTMKLNLNLKGEGYAVHSKLMLLEGVAAAQAQKDGELLDSGVGLSVGDGISELHPSPAVNVVDFGTVHLNQTLTKTLAIANSGKFNFDYVIDRGANPNPMLVLSGAKSSGTVRKNGRILATLTFHPVSPCVLDGAQYVVAVAGKYEYVLKIVGRGVAPNLRFSFSDHDFGPCFIVVPGQPPTRESVVLRVSNQDPHAHLSLDCTLPRNKVLVVECGPRVLAPGEHVEVVLHFTPREMQDYAFPVPFLINGVSTVTVLVKGRGVAARLELVQPSQASCAFGLVREGEDMVKHVQVINRSARALGFDLVDEKDALAKADVTLSPATVSHLRPRGVTTIEVRFSPKRRQREFSEPVFVRYAGGLRQLLTVSGRATGMEVALSTDTLSFGAVCEGSRRTRRLQLENSGDIATRFQWNRSGLGDLFTISPLEGVLRASSEVAFDVTFTPTRVDPDVRVDGMQLFVEGAAPLRLACVGACVPQPDESKQTLDFESVARRADVKSVVVKNPTNKPWFLAPTLKHMEALEHFKAPGEVSVPANGEAALDVSYFPLTMTVDDEPPAEDAEPPAEGEEREARKHVAELFIALPDGSALLYHLRGAAGPPETLVHEPMSTAAKASLPISLSVSNWLGAPQHFDVAFSLDDETASLDSTFLEGTSTFDVEAAETRAYVLRFFSYKVGKTVAVARFTNPASGEYLEHSVEVEVTPAGVISALSLEAPVRQTARRLITIENPLPKDVSVTFPEDWWRCDNPHVKLAKVGTMQGSPEGVFEVEFRPLVPHDRVEASLSFDIEELGEFKYTLTLGATPPAAIPQIKFEAPLGGAQVETFSFPAFPLGASGGGAAKFACSVAKAKFFEVASSIDADVGDEWEGKEVQLQIRFEPEALGAISDVLVVDGGDRGEYRATLTGVCKRPEPRGPFTIEAGGKCDVEFRNVFSEAREFVFTVDHPEFAVATGKANINARSPYTASVSFTPVDPADGSAPPPVVTARMLVDCVDPAGEKQSWTYYLRGQRKAD
ncbi:hypothetical protein AURANDRAFT_62593 [Aureococcus anophagefferens]|uniref:HYDIN/VesB/CFA65-like Ig-like domain-containing protein n=1 Tax=Aureococcus anophagefferens TaxID=44056 RepID=F0Y448_AURAN|nr:hypothetical protein AURANDRAFT_62593 [Aureococcus anophagefferens]EGB10058.1 hypothetical protein AURANDRAFT_62593 [Aureococcus anophagefferens]|eukprot:XP_009034894.1 hypothetical protein AURANDRAFT_62593 [Aureococcus anophagefferens]